MLVGAGLMFVLMHGEVSADSKPVTALFTSNAAPTKEIHCELFNGQENLISDHERYDDYRYHYYCKIKDLTCVTTIRGTSCVKS
jgi:hypothetical protein